MTLSTTPIGAKASMIDLRAGAILREKHSRSASYRGCPAWLILAVILVVKTALISVWLVREYDHLNIGCVASFNDTLLRSLYRRDTMIPFHTGNQRAKRSINGNRLRTGSSMRTSLSASQRSINPFDTVVRRGHSIDAGHNSQPLPPPPISTMVTTTKLDEMPSDSEVTVKMKTIRSRTETVMSMDHELANVQEEMKGVHVTPIVTRFPEQRVEESSTMTTTEGDSDETTKKKRKGKGRKKQRKEEAEKRKKEQEVAQLSSPMPSSSSTSEHTKSPRHLLSTLPTTPSPTTITEEHRSSFIHGAIDPEDPKFTNKGEIRAYPAHVASKRPKGHGRKKGKGKLNISKDTKMMWILNETAYDIYTSTARPSPSEVKDNDGKHRATVPPIHTITIPQRSIITAELASPTSTEASTIPLNVLASAYDLWKESMEKAAIKEGITEKEEEEEEEERVTKAPTVPLPNKEGLREGEEYEDTEGIEDDVKTATSTQTPPPPIVHKVIPAHVPVESEELDPVIIIHNDRGVVRPATTVTTVSRATPPVLHGWDRSKDAAIMAGQINANQVVDNLTREKLKKEEEKRRLEQQRVARPDRVQDFQAQLLSFSESTICIARNLFVMWGILEVICALPFLIGIIAGRRGFFVPTIVMDILLLFIGTLFCVTIIFFSLVLFLFIGDMSPQTLVEWLAFSMIIVGGLLPVAGMFYLTLKASDVLVECRRLRVDFIDSSPEQRLL